jgi:hypothetical protein
MQILESAFFAAKEMKKRRGSWFEMGVSRGINCCIGRRRRGKFVDPHFCPIK